MEFTLIEAFSMERGMGCVGNKSKSSNLNWRSSRDGGRYPHHTEVTHLYDGVYKSAPARVRHPQTQNREKKELHCVHKDGKLEINEEVSRQDLISLLQKKKRRGETFPLLSTQREGMKQCRKVRSLRQTATPTIADVLISATGLVST